MITADVDQDEGPKAELDLCTGPKDAYVVEVHLFVQRRLDCKARTTKRTIFYQFEVVRSHEPASFWRENAIACDSRRHSTTGFNEHVVKCRKQVING